MESKLQWLEFKLIQSIDDVAAELFSQVIEAEKEQDKVKLLNMMTRRSEILKMKHQILKLKKTDNVDDTQTYLTQKRMHIDNIQHLDKIGDLEGLDKAMRKYRDFLAQWTKKGIHKQHICG